MYILLRILQKIINILTQSEDTKNCIKQLRLKKKSFFYIIKMQRLIRESQDFLLPLYTRKISLSVNITAS